jgi:hypothetical protein
MHVELLVAPGCAARQKVEAILDNICLELALEGCFETIVIDTAEMAEDLKFPGSPTVRVNGRDIEPEADKSLNYGLG